MRNVNYSFMSPFWLLEPYPGDEKCKLFFMIGTDKKLIGMVLGSNASSRASFHYYVFFRMRLFGINAYFNASFIYLLALLRSSRLPQALFFFRQRWRFCDFMTCISPADVFPAAAGAFSKRKWRSWEFITCISTVEVFPAAAGAFSSAKMCLC